LSRRIRGLTKFLPRWGQYRRKPRGRLDVCLRPDYNEASRNIVRGVKLPRRRLKGVFAIRPVLKKRLVWGLPAAALAGLALFFWATGFNHPNRGIYPVRGVDVSSYQGIIDWNALAGQNIGFAFIKATEGNRYRDDCFSENWEQARQTDLLVGAYHFFSLIPAAVSRRRILSIPLKRPRAFCRRSSISSFTAIKNMRRQTEKPPWTN
jgi:hypothetical protein